MEYLSKDADVDESDCEAPLINSIVSDSLEKVCENKSVRLWKRALYKIRSIDLDPWLDFYRHNIPVQTATRHRYSAIKKKWVVDEIQVKMESVPFDHGAMRECYRLKKLPQTGIHAGDWQYASNYVAKCYISDVDRQVYFDDVRLQMEAKLWGEAFNRQNPPKKVDIFQLSVLELQNTGRSPEFADLTRGSSTRLYHIERYMEGEYRKYNSNSGFVDEQLRNTPQAFSHFTFERSGHRLLVVDIQGVGDLYTDPQIHTSDGVGYSDGNLGPKGMALFFHSHRCNPLCEYLGLALFDLAPSELSCQQPSRVAADDAAFKPIDPCLPPQAVSTEISDVDAVRDIVPTNHYQEKGAFMKKPSTRFPQFEPGHRRRSVSFNQPPIQSAPRVCQFGPTVARSTENVHASFSVYPRRRCDSSSACSDGPCLHPMDFLPFNHSSRLNSLDDETLSLSGFAALKRNSDPQCPKLIDDCSANADLCSTHPVGSLYGAGQHPKPLYSLEPFNRPQQPRNRISSGDSGYFGRLNLITPSCFGDSELGNASKSLVTHNFMDQQLVCGSTSSLVDFSVPPSPSAMSSHFVTFGFPLSSSLQSAGPEESGILAFGHHNIVGWSNFPVSNGRFGGGFGLLSRRHRNLSESSDIDVEEGHRLASNLLHQLMHESHKPSCADHPTNLDQEIGQSILGQIHHELARLHEAGRFLPGCKGGWSHAGLGGLLLQNRASEHDSSGAFSFNDHRHSPASDSGHSVDWSAVLFHERHAAQLGCLEAMIVMAHYYLGLPTQLMLDCPIKPNENDIRSGVDYLWRAAEGGDRRCMILLARYLDVSASLFNIKEDRITSASPDEFLLLPALQTVSLTALPSVSPDAWVESVTWYRKAVDSAGASAPCDGTPDEGLDAEGRYDAAEDLLPVYRILARMAEMYTTGGYGLKQDYNIAGDLFNEAGELASAARQGRLAAKYFDLGEEAYSKIE
ncbi:hypothetical protein EG68_09651 [Paragonimus skrjabini miyazakii]|uniref:Alpha-type protein kinase domain-containing protein n=1 Tax=Paragonimus skrjabini miyazakii TaxID=59628 RepID=A0A8S9YG26_9TREM|nr:hypothetical protein EG68_09651 [Paragonimus skrjabini miyazakii]